MEKLVGKSAAPPPTSPPQTPSIQPPVSNPDEIALDDEEDDDDNIDRESNAAPETGANDLFFVDTKPQRSKMSLPEPHQISLEQQSCADNAETKLQANQPCQSEINTHVTAANTEGEMAPVVRTMKRRNQEIYANIEDS